MRLEAPSNGNSDQNIRCPQKNLKTITATRPEMCAMVYLRHLLADYGSAPIEEHVFNVQI